MTAPQTASGKQSMGSKRPIAWTSPEGIDPSVVGRDEDPGDAGAAIDHNELVEDGETDDSAVGVLGIWSRVAKFVDHARLQMPPDLLKPVHHLGRRAVVRIRPVQLTRPPIDVGHGAVGGRGLETTRIYR